MLSKKMAFSLTSLITILALAFVITPVMAGDFTVTIEGPKSVRYASDTPGTQLSAILLVVTSDQALPNTLTAAPGDDADNPTNTITVDAYTKDGFSVTKTSGLPAGVTVTDQAVGTEANQYPQRTAKKRRLAVQITPGSTNTIAEVVITIPAFETPDNRVGDDDDMSKEVEHKIQVLPAVSDADERPQVVSIQRLRPGSQTVVAAFQEALLGTDAFDVRIVLTEKHPSLKDGLSVADIKKYFEVDKGEPINLVVGTPFSQLGTGDTTTIPHPLEGMYVHAGTGALAGVRPGVPNSGNVPAPTGADVMYHEYRLRVQPHQLDTADDKPFYVKIHVKAFHDGDTPDPYHYTPTHVESKPNGREQLRLLVKPDPEDKKAGYRVVVPEKIVIPAGGYLVLTKNSAASEIVIPPGAKDKAPKRTERTPAEMLYNVQEASTLPNLASQFARGVVLDVESQHAGLVISEVMWGEDVSLNPPSYSQWIELYNPGAQYKTVNDKLSTRDVNEALTLIFYAPNEFDEIPEAGADGSLPTGVTDRAGTLDTTGKYWSPVGKGQNGLSGTPIERLEERGKDKAVAVEIIPTIAPGAVTPIVSMYRVMEADGTIDAEKGQMDASWKTSAGPKSANFDPTALGIRHGTPGAATDDIDTPADVAADTKAKEDKAKADQAKIDNTGTYPKLGDGRVYISEIMFAGDGLLPQWIEIANGDLTKEFNLSDWTLTVANAVDDADVDVGATATFTIPKGTKIAPSKVHDPAGDNMPSTILVVTESGRNSFTRTKEAGQVINLAVDREVELISAGVLKRRYTLLSDMAFRITLAPGVPAAMKAPAGETAAAKTKRLSDAKKEAALRQAATDMVGNLGKDGAAMWALPTNEDGPRSSIIRKHVRVVRGPKAPEDGIEMDNWELAADTAFAEPTHGSVNESYYGAASDIGTPGFRAGGALPVELSHFRPARDKATGQVVITWATQSELNNAGFFIKRSQQRDGEFKVINATMVPGAGTTSEKQFYTYTDTTAQPNVVYYYQIEDVSLDGNRQTLTRGIRLKGHVGAAGKATTLWGELKASHE